MSSTETNGSGGVQPSQIFTATVAKPMTPKIVEPETPLGTGPDGIRLGSATDNTTDNTTAATTTEKQEQKETHPPATSTSTDAAAAATPKPNPPSAQLVPLTYYPLETQATLNRNLRRVTGKPYAKYFHTALHIYSDATEAIRSPMPQSGYLAPRQASKLLDRGHHAHENGWMELEDGGAYVASRTRFGRDVTGEMIRWWFWWHSLESERYALWFPHCHTRVVLASGAADRARLEDRSVPHVRKWLGVTHRVTEHIGAKELSVHLRFVDPALYGLPWDKLQAAGYEAAVCAEVRDGWEPRLKIGDFVHLWRRDPVTDELELRSRYWFGNEVRLDLPFGFKIPLDLPARLLGIKKMRAGASLAYEHFIHDQTEFTNLASFLPALYADWKAGKL
ncbi:hypothetical protein MCOR25_007024 [Pyricularia grisea]|uniref:DAPG hydrolase PhiG domain-containing protein n=1 Tax=Pyricularia grisea TaxID=148305 RepID=A0A6P8B166_PYRGI|nr:uncharacterized protein PgNI_07881 [Pyricularia grisea]KAI6359516.1 hypothetical protein MCOR25_007024 [Pyricularia grisea]TLD08597.1 hypothetical protein PgNI_07881 [Pyricularia grisea]